VLIGSLIVAHVHVATKAFENVLGKDQPWGDHAVHLTERPSKAAITAGLNSTAGDRNDQMGLRPVICPVGRVGNPNVTPWLFQQLHERPRESTLRNLDGGALKKQALRARNLWRDSCLMAEN
jgi:hypothetical protein